MYKKYTIWNFSLSAEANHSLLVKAAVHIRQLMSFLMKMTSCLAHPLVSDQVHDWTVAVIMIWTWMPQMYRPKEKKYKRFKSKEDSIPLPDPFELPKNFRPDVAAALASGKMTLETKTLFLSTIAGAKRYPTSDDYTNVARSICAKYPFMKESLM